MVILVKWLLEHQRRPEKNLSLTYYSLNIKYTEEGKNTESFAIEKHQVTYKGKHIRITVDFLTETLKARRAWNDVFQALKENNYKPKLLFAAKVPFIIEGEIKTFYNKN
jgi:hypothetical protein